MVSAVSCAFSPVIEKRSLRRRISTSKPASIWRMFSSSGPHRLASWVLSTGVRANSTGFDLGAGLVFADDNFASQAVRQCFGDENVGEGVDQARVAGEIDDPVIVRATGQLVGVLLRRAFYQHALHGADHRFADGLRQFVDALLQTAQTGGFDLGRR